jgi:hypothetical protein
VNGNPKCEAVCSDEFMTAVRAAGHAEHPSGPGSVEEMQRGAHAVFTTLTTRYPGTPAAKLVDVAWAGYVFASEAHRQLDVRTRWYAYACWVRYYSPAVLPALVFLFCAYAYAPAWRAVLNPGWLKDRVRSLTLALLALYPRI